VMHDLHQLSERLDVKPARKPAASRVPKTPPITQELTP
jgi:hypothetical protein